MSSREDCQDKTRSLVKVCGSQNNSPPKEVHILLLRTSDYARLRGKRKLKLQMELRLLISLPCDGEIILDYTSGSNVITSVLKSRRGTQKKESETGSEMDSARDYQL